MAEHISLYISLGAAEQFIGKRLTVDERDLRALARRIGRYTLPERGINVYLATWPEYNTAAEPDHILRGAGMRNIYAFLDELAAGEDVSENTLQKELTLAVANNFEGLKYRRHTRWIARAAILSGAVGLEAILFNYDRLGVGCVAAAIGAAAWVRRRQKLYEAGEWPPFIDEARVAGLRPLRVEEDPKALRGV